MQKMQEYRELQLKLEEEKRIQDKLLREKLKKEEEMIMVERDYKSLQEEVDEQRKLIRVLRSKYKDAVEEIKDLSAEANNEKEYLGTALMEMNKEMTLYKAILHNTFNHDEIDRIVARSKYNPDNKVWKVPNFMFRNSKMSLFNTSQDRIQDMKVQERATSQLYFTKDEEGGHSGDRGSASLPPAVPGSVTPKKKIYGSNWNKNKASKKTLADFSNERNVANRSEYYIGMPSEDQHKYKIVKKLTSSGSGVKLTPIKPGQELTDSSLESTTKQAQSTSKLLSNKPEKVVKQVNAPIEIDDADLSESEEIPKKLKIATKNKHKIKAKAKLFSRGKNSKSRKGVESAPGGKNSKYNTNFMLWAMTPISTVKLE